MGDQGGRGGARDEGPGHGHADLPFLWGGLPGGQVLPVRFGEVGGVLWGDGCVCWLGRGRSVWVTALMTCTHPPLNPPSCHVYHPHTYAYTQHAPGRHHIQRTHKREKVHILQTPSRVLGLVGAVRPFFRDCVCS